MFCVILEYGKETVNSILDVALATSYASRTRPDKNYVQIQKNCISLGYITKLIVLYQAEQTDDFYTPSSA